MNLIGEVKLFSSSVHSFSLHPSLMCHFHYLLSPVHLTGFSFHSFSDFLGIFNVLWLNTLEQFLILYEYLSTILRHNRKETPGIEYAFWSDLWSYKFDWRNSVSELHLHSINMCNPSLWMYIYIYVFFLWILIQKIWSNSELQFIRNSCRASPHSIYTTDGFAMRCIRKININIYEQV